MNQKLLTDIAERAAWTFAQTFLSLFVFTGALDTDISSAKQAAFAGIAAVIAVLKGFVASRVGSDNTAATLPREKDTPLPGDDGMGDR